MQLKETRLIREAVEGLGDEVARLANAAEAQADASEAQARATGSLADAIWALINRYARAVKPNDTQGQGAFEQSGVFCRALISSRVTRLSHSGRVHATFNPILWGKHFISGDIICITRI